VIVRLLVWSLFDSDTTVHELQDTLPELEEPSTWLWNEASQRFGAVLFDDDADTAGTAVERARELIGRDPGVYEEFDAL
jgi:hypothetical protein